MEKPFKGHRYIARCRGSSELFEEVGVLSCIWVWVSLLMAP